MRDGYCRVRTKGLEPYLGPCRGASQWAHFGPKKRSKTVGMAPEDRHAVDGSLMLCDGHHDAYDEGAGDDRLWIDAKTPDGTNGDLEYTRGDIIVTEIDGGVMLRGKE